MSEEHIGWFVFFDITIWLFNIAMENPKNGGF